MAKRLSAPEAERELQEGVDWYYRWWLIYDWLAAGMIVLSILLSFFAGINAAHPFIKSPPWAAVLAGAPAVLLAIERTTRLRGRSKWFWNMVLEYQDIQ